MKNNDVVKSNNLLLLTLIGFLLSISPPLASQPDVLSTRVLFEPRPIPENEDQAIALVSFNNATGQTPTAATGNEPLTATERRELENTIADYVLAIGDEESTEGPYSSQLPQDLMSAGYLAQELGDHDRALDFFMRAQSVTRINEGLETLNQVPIMKAIVVSHMAQENTRDADRVQENILYMAEQVHGEKSIEIIPTLLEYGIWNMDAFLERSNILLNVNRMNVTQFITDPNNYIVDNNSLRDSPLFNLYQAQKTFLQSIEILIQNQQYHHPQILDLEKMLLKSYFLSIHRENILYEPDFYLTRKKSKTGSRLNTNAIELMESEEYKMGIASHDRSLAYISSNPERTATMVASAMLEGADWHLLYERKVKAAREYQAIYDFYSDYPEMNSDLTELLYPEFPVILPVYLPPPNSREKLDIRPDEQVSYFGYFDVSLRINKYGKAKGVRILQRGGEVTRNMEIRLNQYFQNVLFRPLFREGKPFTDDFELRYYVGI